MLYFSLTLSSEIKQKLHISKFMIQGLSVTFTFAALLDSLTHLCIHINTLKGGTHANASCPLSSPPPHTQSGTHALLDFEALRPSCPSFQTLSRQEKNLGHQLSSLNLSITVTLDHWCRTHLSSPAGPLRTGLAWSIVPHIAVRSPN